MGNTSAKVIPMMRSRKDKNKNKVHANMPAPLSPIVIWKNNMHTFMNNHITELQNYTEQEIYWVRKRLQRFEAGQGIPLGTRRKRFINALAEVNELFTALGDWQVMQNKACELVNFYMAEQRQSDLEEIAYVFCVLVIAPQIVRNETRWSWETI
jgi:hypothetical protein